MIYLTCQGQFNGMRLARGLLATCWVWSLLLSSPPLLGWGSYAREFGNNIRFVHWSSLLTSELHSHWSGFNEARLSLVESFIVLLRQCLLCHKEPARRIKSLLLGAFCLLLAGSLCHKDSWLPCTERSYFRPPYAIKNQ